MTEITRERIEALWRGAESDPNVAVPVHHEVLTELCALALKGLEGAWRTDLENAPRRENIDLWITPPSDTSGPFRNKYSAERFPHGFRVADAMLLPSGLSATQDGKYVTGRWYHDSDGDECLDPDDTSNKAFRVSHWRSITPPGESK